LFFHFNSLLTFNFSKKSEHLHQPNKQFDNQEDKVGSDGVQRGVQIGASPNPSEGGGTESPLLTSPLGEEIGTYPYPLPKGRELRTSPLVGGR
jgi:hypothetical protein